MDTFDRRIAELERRLCPTPAVHQVLDAIPLGVREEILRVMKVNGIDVVTLPGLAQLAPHVSPEEHARLVREVTAAMPGRPALPAPPQLGSEEL
jgi:hypothetical protein